MALDSLNSISPGDILEALRGIPLLHPFHLVLFHEQGQPGELRHVYPCGNLSRNAVCEDLCWSNRTAAVRSALDSRAPVVFTCSLGLLNFALPFHADHPVPFCLLAGAVKEAGTDPILPESISRNLSLREDAQALMERLERLPVLSRAEVEQIAAKAASALPALLEKNLPSLALEKTTRCAKAISEVAREIDRAASAGEVVEQLSESLVVLFDLPRLAVYLTENDGRRYVLSGGLGIPEAIRGEGENRLGDYLHRRGEEIVVSGDDMEKLFPELSAKSALGIPLTGGDSVLGMAVLLDIDLHPRDRLMARMLCDRAAVRLSALRRQQELLEDKTVSRRLISMISALSLMENQDALYRNIVEMAAELLQATRGSLMLLDPRSDLLRIESVKGMSLPLARSMTTPVGSGIAGKVAQSGFPLLVCDIEKDSRVGIANRPRFHTKSFISIPLKPKDAVIGVLNLADKENGCSFNESDLNLVSSFAAHAATMLERTIRLERANLLEELSVTDPLTGLYNRRFLEKRLEEELSRSSRQNLNFTLILLDLDHFKSYNDLCGHLAGDHALKQVATLLRAAAREMDVVTRYGGEEFCILLPGTSKRESMFVAERMRRTIEKESFPQEAKLPHKRLSASLGISSFPEDGYTAVNLIHAADVALYKAKSDGRNRVVLFDHTFRDLPAAGKAGASQHN